MLRHKRGHNCVYVYILLHRAVVRGGGGGGQQGSPPRDTIGIYNRDIRSSEVDHLH